MKQTFETYKDFVAAALNYIIEDLEARGEEPVSDVKFMAAIFRVDIKKDGKISTVVYSGAEVVMNGYRKLFETQQTPTT